MKVRIIYTHPGLACATGGEYGEGVIYTHLAGEKWQRRYYSSAEGEFDFCPGCGGFHEPPECPLAEVGWGEVLEEVIRFLQSHPDYYMEPRAGEVILHPHTPKPAGECCWR